MPVIVDLVDVDSQKFFDYAEHARGIKKWLYQLEGQATAAAGMLAAARAKAITLVSEAEVRAVSGFSAPTTAPSQCPTVWISITFGRRTMGPIRGTAARIGADEPWFVGRLTITPMLMASHGLPAKFGHTSDRTFPTSLSALVGRNPTSAVRSLARIPGIRVFRLRARCASLTSLPPTSRSLPCESARGIQNKVLEAMAMGKPVVCSPAALEGIQACLGEHLEVCQSSEAWRATVGRLVGRRDECSRVGQNAIEFVVQTIRGLARLGDVPGVSLGGLSARPVNRLRPQLMPVHRWSESLRNPMSPSMTLQHSAGPQSDAGLALHGIADASDDLVHNKRARPSPYMAARKWAGYYSPEDQYEALVDRLVRADMDLSDVGCGRAPFPSHPASCRRKVSIRVVRFVGIIPIRPYSKSLRS